MDDALSVLSADGPLARALPGFAPREAQQCMAQAVEEVLAEKGVLIAEAGTGTGKTFAYLVPALLSARRVIVSTGTKTLQDQLFHRDIPTVLEALGISVPVALLKGRANYLCHYRLTGALAQATRRDRTRQSDLQKIRDWARRSRSGDIAEMTEVSEASPLWPQVTSTPDNCLGQECPDFDDCFVARARRRAQEADLVVINHHLLFADMALKEEGFGDLLPGADAFILDEAHQLPEVATSFFGLSLSSRQLSGWARDIQTEFLREGGALSDLPDALDGLEKALRELHLALGEESRRFAWREVVQRPRFEARMDDLDTAVQALETWLAGLPQRGKGLEACSQRGTHYRDTLALIRRGGGEEGLFTRWAEARRRSWSLHLTPLEVAEPVRQQMEGQNAAWILTSATLAVGGGFDHFMGQLGIEEAHTLCLESPFDYGSNALLYTPPEMPEPASRDYTRRVVEAALPVLQASRGRAFLLFTSHRALQEAHRLLEGRIPWPLLVQGSLPRGELLRRFRELGDAVLLGSQSFWEGVDVRGEALSCVIIDKLPFASPGDPVLAARIDLLRERGGNPFMDYQLPHAVISLKQGVGRLIRDVDDRGVLMLCDPRLQARRYGAIFLRSLPPMRRTDDLAEVRAFFRSMEIHEDTGT